MDMSANFDPLVARKKKRRRSFHIGTAPVVIVFLAIGDWNGWSKASSKAKLSIL